MTTNAGDGNDFMVGGAGSETMVGINVEPEIAPEPTGHGLPLGKCEAYNRVYDQSCGSS